MFALFKKAATKNDVWPYSHEIKTMMVFVAGLFLTVCLFTYNPTDHSWFYYDTNQLPIANSCGYVGACISALFFYLFGTAAFIGIIFTFFLFYYLFAKKTVAQEWDRIAAYILLLFVSAALCAVHHITLWAAPIAGGYFGRSLKLLCYSWFDEIGSYILLYALLFACLIVIIRFSFIGMANYLLKHISIARLRVYCIDPVCNGFILLHRSIKKIIMRAYNRIPKKCLPYESSDKTFDGGTLDESASNDILDDAFWREITQKNQKNDMLRQAQHERSEVHDKQDQNIAQSVHHEQEKIIDQAALDHSPLSYELPHLDMFIGVDEEQNDHALIQELEKRAIVLQEKLERFDVFGKVTAIKRGPVVTLFEYQPQIDTKISKIIALEDDLSLALQATSIRIIAPIPGRSVVGFEVANKHRRGVMLAQLIKSDAHKETTASLPMVLGVDTIGNTIIIDLAKMPHLLMAGSTGSGKSVALNAMLISLLCKKTPDDLRLIVIDPKRLEFAPFADIAHLLFPIVTDPKQAPSVLRWVVKQMEQRYEIMSKTGARNINDYRAQAEKNNLESMPFIVVVIDELADLMMCAGKEVEDAIIRITQMARAAGIHLIAATQRPSVDVITGLIKVNFPSRISFRVTSKIDSRTILDCAGADKLLGKGDMLFLDANDSLLKRVHGAYVLDKEINQVIAHIRAQRPADYLDVKQVCADDRVNVDAEQDAMYEEICQFLHEIDEVSISLLQRRFRIGYNRSARIIDMLESQGLIAPSYGGKTRKVVR